MSDWPLWEVFVRAKGGLSHRHVGSVHAPDPELALRHARDTYTSKEALGYDPVSGYPLTEVWVDPDNQTEFKLVPQFYNCDSIGYRYDLIGEDITSWGALLDDKYKGKVAILNDSLLTPGWVAGYLKKSGQMEIARTDNMTHEELDQVINFMIERKKAAAAEAEKKEEKKEKDSPK